jgi:hypothetical protein
VDQDPLVVQAKRLFLEYAKRRYPQATRAKIIVSIDLKEDTVKIASVTVYEE